VSTLVLVSSLLEASPRPTLVLMSRGVSQEQTTWHVEYRFSYRGETQIDFDRTRDARVEIDSWVSNSAVPVHGLPRKSHIVLEGSEWQKAFPVIESSEEEERCFEKISAQLSLPGQQQHLLSLAPNGELTLRLKFEHLHDFYGDLNLLLGTRTLKFKIGQLEFIDSIPLNQEEYKIFPEFTWPKTPSERQDHKLFVSAPFSIHLEAQTSGLHQYHPGEFPVRNATPMSLSFYYFIAGGTEADCSFLIRQIRQIHRTHSWKVFGIHDIKKSLTTIGKWTKVVLPFITAPEANFVSMDFKIKSDTELGEMWIDDVELKSLSAESRPSP
jgi:hypothetical protein